MTTEIIIYYECNHSKTVSEYEIDNFCVNCNKIKSIIRIDTIQEGKRETIHNYGDNQGVV